MTLTPLERLNELEEINGNTPAEIVEHALSMLALYGGNQRKTAENTNIPRSTLQQWRERYPNRYQAACERHHVEIEARIVATQREIVQQASQRVLDALDAAEDPKDSKTLSELAKASQSFQTTAGIGTTKILELTGRPTNVTMHVDARDTLKRISSRFGGALIVDAEVVEDSPTSRELTAESGPANARDAGR